MSIDETETFFHEFGHALHCLFSDVKYRGLSGVEGDFVELPSQIMENWAFATPMLKQYAVHYRRGEVMPDDMIRRIHESAKFNEGFNTTELVAAALSDLDIHSVQSADKIDVADEKIGKAGSPTSVAKAFPKSLKPAGEQYEVDAEQAVGIIVSKLKEKFII